MNKIRLIAMLLGAVSLSSVAAEEMHNGLVIQAVPASESTVVIEGVPKYEKTFNVAVYSQTDQPIELTGYTGCYKAFDEQGKEFDEWAVYEGLLGTLNGETKAGSVSFISDDDSVYKAKFVKWSLHCSHLVKREK